MKVLLLAVLLGIGSPNANVWPHYDALNAQMASDYYAARSTVLSALTPPHRQLLGSVAAHLATSANPDYSSAIRQLDGVLSPIERRAIMSAYDVEHEKMRAIMRKLNAVAFSQHDMTVGHLGLGTRFNAPTSAGAFLLWVAMGDGPPTFNAMIVTR
jgi:hypothetical protein